MSGELFRTTFINRDPRLLKVYISCQYCIASLFLGMFLVLSGIMVSSYYSDIHRNKGLTESQIKYNSKMFGLIIMISGCVLLFLALILFFYSALMFLKTKTTPPEDNWINLVEDNPQTHSALIVPQNDVVVNGFDG